MYTTCIYYMQGFFFSSSTLAVTLSTKLTGNTQASGLICDGRIQITMKTKYEPGKQISKAINET